MNTVIISSRLDALRRVMENEGIDGMWITSAENHRYICGFHNPDGQVLVTARSAYVFADFRYIEAARREVCDSFQVIMPQTRRGEFLPKLLRENEVSRLGFEDDKLSYRSADRLRSELPGVEIVPAGDIFPSLRLYKSDDEIDLIRRAQRIAEKAFGIFLTKISYDMTELDAAAELEYQMKLCGSEEKSFDTIAVSGSASSSPHGVPRPVKLERGFLTMDFGATVGGYHSDMTRTVCIGKADGEMRRLYNTVLRAQIAALEYITDGVRCREADAVARDIIDGAGYKGCFGHSLGHGVGLEIHELPNLSPYSPTENTVTPGMIVTVEPGIYIEGKYGCRIEDMVAIRLGSAENLTNFPKELIEI